MRNAGNRSVPKLCTNSIEFPGNSWKKDKMIPSSELLEMISKSHPDVRKAPDELNDTARSYVIPGHLGSFGFISSMSDHFCGSCNRLRITADGQIKVYTHSPIFPWKPLNLLF